MRAASPALIALLASSDRFIMADLYTITLVGGSVLRYSAAPTALFANGYTFALGPKFERSKTKIVIGTQVDELEVKIYTEPTDLIGGLPFLQAAWQGSSTAHSCSSNARSWRPMAIPARELWSSSLVAFRILTVLVLASTSNAARTSSF